MKSGERTDKADGHIQDRPRFLTGSKVSPPTHPKTNKFCDDEYGTRKSTAANLPYRTVPAHIDDAISTVASESAQHACAGTVPELGRPSLVPRLYLGCNR